MKAILKNARQKKGLKLREVAAALGVDQSLISKFESGDRLPTEKQLRELAHILEVSHRTLLVEWLSLKVLAEVKPYSFADEVLQMVQEHLKSYSPRRIPLSERLQILLDDLDALKQRLDALRTDKNFRIDQALEMEYTFESNRIEGNTLTLRETDLIINEGLTVSGKSMREHLEAINHKEAIDYVNYFVSSGTILNERELLSVHNLILRGILPEEAGKYRQVQVMISGSQHIPPSPHVIKDQMEAYFDWYEHNRMHLHPVVLAAEMHERLVTIHPFIDGNGRTSRLIMNAILLQNGFVIANIKGDYDTRRKYYDALELVQTSGNKESFILLIAETERTCLERYLSILER